MTCLSTWYSGELNAGLVALSSASPAQDAPLSPGAVFFQPVRGISKEELEREQFRVGHLVTGGVNLGGKMHRGSSAELS